MTADDPIALIFDLDGTLIDSAPDIHAAVNLMLSRRDIPPLTLPTVTSFVGNGLPKLVERVMHATEMDPAEFKSVTSEVLADYDWVNGRMTRPYPGVVEALGTLRDMGHPMSICTNKPTDPALHILKKLDLAEFFHLLVGGDSLEVTKPRPEPLLAAIEGMDSTPDRALYIGDSEVDAETASAAGVRFALFTMGYRKSPIEEMPHDARFDDFSELVGIVGSDHQDTRTASGAAP
ncbi:MAG: phosphoglycolate phosphatase [Pseudomonadota bacterium]